MLFPVAGPCHFVDDFGVPKPDGRSHEGNDIFAAEGTPVVAVDAGTMLHYQGPLGGNSLTVTAPDSTRYYYAHLSGYEGPPRTVRAGEVIGYVGHTGNAAATSPHLHFEIHPGGAARAVDPYARLRAAMGLLPSAAPRSSSPLGVLAGLALLVGIAAASKRG